MTLCASVGRSYLDQPAEQAIINARMFVCVSVQVQAER